jgi:hypothetical protein
MSTQSQHINALAAGPAERERIAKLLSHYPEVNDGDTAQIISFLKKGPHLDVGMLTGDESLKPKLQAFMSEHKQHFRLKISEVIAVTSGIVGALLILWLVWEAIR